MGPPTQATTLWKVKDLMSPILPNGMWRLFDKFYPILQHEDEILSLILSDSPLPDKLWWLPKRSRKYTTKSGYSLSKILADSVSSDSFSWRKNVWKVVTSPKIKMFLWKTVCNAISVGKLLAIRGVEDVGFCKRCGGDEDVIHVLGSCPFAQRVWALAPITPLPNLGNLDSVKKLLEAVAKSISLPPVGLGTAPLYPWILWYLWKAQNLLLFENRVWSEKEVLLKVTQEAKNWEHALQLQPTKKKELKRQEADLEIHPKACLCFSDAAWKETTKGCGLEAMTLKATINASLAMSVVRLVCNSDCQDLIGLINSGGQANELDGILNDIRLLSLRFLSILFCFVPRTKNAEADALAKASLLSCNVSSLAGD
ncbi:PREDICTED: uncharacterized protein LOC109133253 [Camelina sativa]|uniref:Uncharacterized protein LOC109133253 n=1 Tax=Camelina sativa TaxID=90675 RepID=A0ABM1RRZ2_CAMSA|nr:PREDICTED: uncharacterized protein LOC109133253 [Camelina sativa]